jgi:hypothetical protein
MGSPDRASFWPTGGAVWTRDKTRKPGKPPLLAATVQQFVDQSGAPNSTGRSALGKAATSWRDEPWALLKSGSGSLD